ncbi:hypothetical protein LTR37_003471 [Vermiconidia calcicola]|uniref:Uncharacterized protein n=1 Tax=Vermiconidia calcicola TaxID=1690605 RepID=A0ACC3NPY1_9PEZI|nr:hypothetical protein LTR37_003471 [Vermiconidia calcicola]
MISEEVKMLQRDHPSPSFGEPDANTLRPPGAGKTVDPEAVGQNVSPGRMGDNDTATQEGPLAQGVGRPVAADEDVPDRTALARGARTPHDALEEPAEGGASVMDSIRGEDVGTTTTRAPNQNDAYAPTSRRTSTQKSTQSVASQAIQPKSPARAALLHGPYTPSTIAGSGFESVIEDRIRTVAEPGQSDDSRDARYLAQKLMDGQLVRFVSKQERAAVEEEAKKIAAQRAQEHTRWKKVGKDDVQPSPPTHKFAPLPEAVQTSMIDKLVAGKYDQRGLWQSTANHKRPVLDTIARMTLKNDKDGTRLLEKVRSLLPAEQTALPGAKGGQQSAQKQKAR